MWKQYQSCCCWVVYLRLSIPLLLSIFCHFLCIAVSHSYVDIQVLEYRKKSPH